MTFRKNIRILSFLCLTAAALAAAFFLWRGGALLRLFSPWSVWTAEKHAEDDAAGRTYRVELRNRRVTVCSVPSISGSAVPETAADNVSADNAPAGAAAALSGSAAQTARVTPSQENMGTILWKSPAHLRVQDFLFCDIDSDGLPELLLLCWYLGEPALWDSGQPVIAGRQWTQHIYIYKPDKGTMHDHWLASRIMQNIAFWEYDPELRLCLTGADSGVTRWDWHGWGLKYFADGYPEVKFLVSGDNLIHQGILEEGQRKGGFEFLYEHIAPELQKADIAVLGQETIFVKPFSGYSGYPLFRTPVYVGEAALNAGFNAAACATNHALDAGTEGINTTAEFYESRGIPYLGIRPSLSRTQAAAPDAGLPYHLFEKNRVRIAMFNYTYGTNVGNPEKLRPGAVHVLTDRETVLRELSEGRNAADAVIVLVHWGTEYSPSPDAFQREWAEVFLEGGADAVIGSHPHVLQPVELLTAPDGRQVPVYWSLGNLVSRQDQPERVVGGLAELTVRRVPGGAVSSSASGPAVSAPAASGPARRCQIADRRLVPVVTHQTEDHTTVYLLDEYTEALAAEHRLKPDLERLRGFVIR